jgi:hypothetical protein
LTTQRMSLEELRDYHERNLRRGIGGVDFSTARLVEIIDSLLLVRGTLEFYADRANYAESWIDSNVAADGGIRAQIALEDSR